jgi:hypothetical protein
MRARTIPACQLSLITDQQACLPRADLFDRLNRNKARRSYQNDQGCQWRLVIKVRFETGDDQELFRSIADEKSWQHFFSKAPAA